VIGPLEFLVVLAFSILMATWLVALADAIGRPAAQWRWTGRPKPLWVALVVFLWAPGAIAYWVIAFPALREVERRAVTGKPTLG